MNPEQLAGITGRDRVVIGIDGDPELAAGPQVEHAQGWIGMGVEWEQPWVFLGEQGIGLAMGFAVDADVGDRVEPEAGGGVEGREADPVQAGQEVLLHVSHRVFDAPLFMRLSGGTSPDVEAVMAGEVQVVGLEDGGLAAGVAQDGDLGVVDLLFPTEICGRLRPAARKLGKGRCVRSHNVYGALSHFTSSASSRQMGFRGDAPEETEAGGWHACNAASFIGRLISA
jgi:hypothetical protein